MDRGIWHVMAGLTCPIRLAGFGLQSAAARTKGFPTVCPPPTTRVAAGRPSAVSHEEAMAELSAAAAHLVRDEGERRAHYDPNPGQP